MTKQNLIFIPILVFFGCDHQTKTNYGIEILTDDGPTIETNTMLMISSGSVMPSQDIKLNRCNFTIVIDDNKDTIHWSTADTMFRTPEGFKIGSKWSELPIKLRESIQKMSGWGYYIGLRSGWQLGFCKGASCTDTLPNNSSKVQWIFKKTNLF